MKYPSYHYQYQGALCVHKKKNNNKEQQPPAHFFPSSDQNKKFEMFIRNCFQTKQACNKGLHNYYTVDNLTAKKMKYAFLRKKIY